MMTALRETAATVAIEVRNIRKEYSMGNETVIALKKVNITIKQGEICYIFGSSGSGKSTLLNQLAGMEKPTRGYVNIGGINISCLNENELAAFRQRHLGFIFQSYNLLPFLTAVENVALPLMFQGIGKEEREKRAKSLLNKVGLEKRYGHYPNQMSGGQQQRVGIARAFIARPKVVFADEPTGNLDSKTTIEVMEMVKHFSVRYNQTIVLVTHEPELSAYANRIITLKDGEVISNQEVNNENR